MPITLTKTDICNGALSLIAQPPITDLDTDESEEGDVCRIHYLRTRQKCFAQYPWRFAQKTVQLTADPVKTNDRYSASFLVPADFITITETDLDEEKIYYFLEGDRIIIESFRATPTFFLTYTFQEENVGRYSPWFVEYFEAELAYRMSYALLKDRRFTQDMFTTAEFLFREAANRDSNQERNYEYLIDELSVVRNLRA